MAPAKPSASNVVAKGLAPSLSPPVSLLWAHQLRREHSVLLERIEDLASAFSNMSQAKLKQDMTSATEAQEKSAEIESELVSIKKRLHQADQQEKTLRNQVVGVCDRLNVSEEGILALQRNARTIKERFQRSLIEGLATLEQNLQHHLEEQEQQVQELKAHIGDLQYRLPDIVKGGAIGIRDSMEETVEQINQIAERPLYPTNRVTGSNTLPTSGLMQSDIEIRPNFTMRANPYTPSDIDLDGNMLTPDPEAEEVGQALPGETIALLREVPTSNSHQHQDLSSLKQGKLESLDQYLAAGEILISKLPKRKEGTVVEVFVDGIYDDELRINCEKTLNELTWSWENVKIFVKKSVGGLPETQPIRRAESLAHKHKKGVICPVCPTKADLSQSRKTSIEIGNTTPQKLGPRSAHRALIADPRRSQRIFQQNEPSPVRGEMVPRSNAQRSRPPQYDDTSQVIPQGISAQKAAPREGQPNADIAKEKPVTPELSALGLLKDGGILAIPQNAAQQRNLEVLRQDQRIWTERTTTPKLTRQKKRASFQETQAPSPAKLQPVAPMNDLRYQGICARASSDVEAGSGVREIPKKQGSKKRKLVAQLEFLETSDHEVVTAPDETMKHSKAKEPEGEKRRKKRAALPIPLIPILPLSDDE